MYTRFNYIGLEKLRNLYKVIRVLKPITIPKTILYYYIYALTKIKNSILKKLLLRKDTFLILMQFDIIGLFL